jgi:YfiH family protein
VAFQQSNLQSLSNISHGFGGIDHADLAPGLFVCVQQHGADIVEISHEHSTGTIAADAVFTRSTRSVAVVTADCLPILISSSKDRFVAAIHGGWKGLSGDIIARSLVALCEAGFDLKAMQVAIGPAIGPCCYEVDLPFIERLEQRHGRLWKGRVAPWSMNRTVSAAPAHSRAPHTEGHPWLDLAAYCIYLLEDAGLDRSQVTTVEECTYCSSAGLGSYRRRGHKGEAKTFQYSWIGLTR